MIQVNEPEYCKLDVFYTPDPELVKSKKEMAVKALNKNKVRVPGFRAGKATLQAYQYYMKNQLKDHIVKELQSEAIQDLIHDFSVKPMFQPQIISSELDGNDCWLNMTVLKRPTVKLTKYFGWDIPNPPVESIDQALATSLENLRQQYSDYQPFSDTDIVQNNDKLTLDMKIYLDDKLIHHKDGELHTVGEMPEIESHLVGMKLNESKTFETKCEKNFPVLEAQDKTVKFEVSIFMGLKTIPCALDDSLAIKLGLKDFKEVESTVKNMVTSKLGDKKQLLINQQIVHHLLDEYVFQIPTFLTELEVQKLLSDQKIKSSDLSDEQHKAWCEQANKNIRLSIILDEIRDKEPDCRYSTEEIINGIRNNLIAQGQNPEQWLQQAQQNGTLLGYVSALCDQLTLNFIIKNCNIIE